MPCNDYWYTADDKKMWMHEMTDSHLLNAWAKLDRLHEEADPEDVYVGEMGESLAQLEIEAERRWECVDGEREIRLRLARRERARSGEAPVPPIVGRKPA